jgi:hypothetical protein
LSHSKRLPRATGTVDFIIERGRAAPPRQKSVAVAAPRFSLTARRDHPRRRERLRWEGVRRRRSSLAKLACQLRPRHQRAQGIDRHSLSGSLRRPKLYLSQDHGHDSFAAALVDHLQANFGRARHRREA